MGLHDRYYGDKCVPIPTQRSLIVDALFRKPIPNKEEPMRAESYEVVTSKPRIRPARNYRDVSKDHGTDA